MANSIHVAAWYAIVDRMARVLGYDTLSFHVWKASIGASGTLTVVCRVVVTKNDIDVFTMLVFHEEVRESGAVRDELWFTEFQ